LPIVLRATPIADQPDASGDTVLADIERTLVSLARDLGTDTVTEIVELYVADSQRHVVNIQAGLAKSDAHVVRVAAHTLKSTAATVGALPLAETCNEIERLARESRIGEVGKLVDQLTRQEAEARLAVIGLQPKFAALASADAR
jgi:HPt (histidine-containing phosphotransfer) domain-containing protein